MKKVFLIGLCSYLFYPSALKAQVAKRITPQIIKEAFIENAGKSLPIRAMNVSVPLSFFKEEETFIRCFDSAGHALQFSEFAVLVAPKTGDAMVLTGKSNCLKYANFKKVCHGGCRLVFAEAKSALGKSIPFNLNVEIYQD